MDKKQNEILSRIISDKTSGSSELLLKLNKFLLSNINDKDLIIESLSLADSKLPHFAAVKNYLEELKNLSGSKNSKSTFNFLYNHLDDENIKIKSIFSKIYKKLPSARKILTISKSGTVLNVFKLWCKKNKNLNIIVTESRPASEGKLMAKELLKIGFKVQLITDAMSGIFVPKVDAVIIGADVVLNNGNVINKTGSLALALFCKHYKKPFFVLAAKSKIVNKKRHKILKEGPDRIWKYTHKNLTRINIPFEEIERELITEIISD